MPDALQLRHEGERTWRRTAGSWRKLSPTHLRRRILRDGDNQKLLDGIGLQHVRGRLIEFLRDPQVEATNNRAERALRPAVIAQGSHCSRDQRGAEPFAAFTGTIRTIRKKGLDPAGYACRPLRSPFDRCLQALRNQRKTVSAHKAFYGTSGNAVKAQIWIAVAVYV